MTLAPARAPIRVCVPVLAWCLAALAASPATADCLDDERLEVRPTSDAMSVVIDPILRARYPGDPAVLATLWDLYEAGEPLMKLNRVVADGTYESVPGQLWRGGDRMLFFEPDQELETGDEYELSVASPDGNFGPELFRFQTGFRADEGPPQFAVDEDSLSLIVSEASDDCGPAGSLRVGLGFPEATDDGDPTMIEHFAYLTRAAGLEAPRLVDRAGRGTYVAGDPSFNFVLSPQEAQQPVCLRLRAVDGRLNVAENEPEICFDPVQGSFFRPLCAVAAPGAPRGRSESQIVGVFLLLSGLAWRIRRRRTPV